jgi:hypothetical protein
MTRSLSVLTLLVLLLAACATVPRQALEAGNATPRLLPGARCDYDDQCGSGICDAYECRGPMPEPGPGAATRATGEAYQQRSPR